VQDPFNVQCNPTDQGDEGEIDVIRSTATEAVAAVDVLPVAECDSLFELSQGCHGDVAVGSLYVGLVDYELQVVSMLSAESMK
jgi:hypothetical protein